MKKNSSKSAILGRFFYIFNYIFQLNTKIPRVMIYTSISIDFDLLNPMKPFI